MPMARDPYAVVVEMVTAVSLAPERLEDRVQAIADILIGELGAAIGLLTRVTASDAHVQVIGGRLHQGLGVQGTRHQFRDQLDDPLLGPVTRGDLAPTTAARAHGRGVWQSSAARTGCMITFGVDQIATLPVHGGPDAVLFVVGRSGPDFTDDDLALLSAVQPVVTGLGMLLSFPSGPVPGTGAGQGPGLTEQLDAVAEDHQGGDRLDLEHPGQLLLGLGVDLGEREVGVLAGDLFEHGGERAARATPRRPEVDQGDPVGRDGGFEVGELEVGGHGDALLSRV